MLFTIKNWKEKINNGTVSVNTNNLKSKQLNGMWYAELAPRTEKRSLMEKWAKLQ